MQNCVTYVYVQKGPTHCTARTLYLSHNFYISGDKAPGDLGLGQTGFNPFGFKYSEEEYFEKQVQEIKHGR